MSKYTTGEAAKLCGVTVRTVQYYDTRGILIPSELSEGGRRLYSEEDVKRLKVICFLRELGLSIDTIRQLLAEKDPGSVIVLLLDQQAEELKSEIEERETKLNKLEELKSGLKSFPAFSVDSIGDIASIMASKKELKKVHRLMLLTGLPLNVFQWIAILLWIAKGIWWPFLIWIAAAAVYCLIMAPWYFRKVAYICPQCHTVFRPNVTEAFFAGHTPSTRKLTCPACAHHGFCVEIAAEKENSENEQKKG